MYTLRKQSSCESFLYYRGDLMNAKNYPILLEAQKSILEKIIAGFALEQVLESIVLSVEQIAPNIRCSILLIKDNRLFVGAAPNFSEAYNQAIDGTIIGATAGACGAAVYRREMVIVTDIANDPICNAFRDIALANNLRSCWSLPIFSTNGDVIGTFGLYYTESRAPHSAELQLLDYFTNLTGMVIEQYHKEERLRETEARYREILHNMAYHDPLTNLPNRRYIDDQITKETIIANQFNYQFSILFVNLDQFKPINNSYGRTLGDAVILEIANRISNFIGANGTVGHLGGDEFIILLPNSRMEYSTLIGEQLLKEIEKPLQYPDFDLYITASIGMSFYPKDGADAESLQKSADMAMNKAKEKGGNDLYIFDENIHTDTYEWLSLYNDMHKALAEEEFVLYFQPKLDVKTNAITGLEVLIRWQHPHHGIISPAIFIPLAEKYRFIHELGRWVLFTACKQAKSWQLEGFKPTVISVNISARQLEAPNFTEIVKDILTQTKLDGQWLEIEITESMLVGNKESTTQTLNALKSLGVRITIDDFGTGYSSLSYIQKFPIDSLKIDQSFISELTKNPDSSLVPAIIKIGHSLNLRVVAEGVEEEAQLEYLRKHGCDEWQGFLYSKPVPNHVFEEMFQSLTERV